MSHSTVALCKLLQHSLNTDDKRLQDIAVKGEEIFSPEDGIRTRSKSVKSKLRQCHRLNLYIHLNCQYFTNSDSRAGPETLANVELLVFLLRPREMDQYSIASKDF